MRMNPDFPLNEEEQEDLVAYLDGELDEDATQSVETRMGLDPAVRSEADTLKRTWELLDYLPRPEPSPSFTERTLTKLNARQTQEAIRSFRMRRWLIRCGWAAAVLLVGGAGYALTQMARPTPHNDQELVRDLGVVENVRQYEQGESVDFLKQLNDPDLFGDQDS